MRNSTRARRQSLARVPTWIPANKKGGHTLRTWRKAAGEIVAFIGGRWARARAGSPYGAYSQAVAGTRGVTTPGAAAYTQGWLGQTCLTVRPGLALPPPWRGCRTGLYRERDRSLPDQNSSEAIFRR